MKKLLFLSVILLGCQKSDPEPSKPVQTTTNHHIVIYYSSTATPINLAWTGYNTSGMSPASYVSSDTVYDEIVNTYLNPIFYSIKAKSAGSNTVTIYLDGAINQTATANDSAYVQMLY